MDTVKSILHNIANEEDIRGVQSKTLGIIKNALKKSFGPKGSNTTIIQRMGEAAIRVVYTKDGHNIMKAIEFQDVVESAVKDDIENITRNIVNKVGDGTTSAVILSANIFEELYKLSLDKTPFEIIREFKDTVELIIEEILKEVQPFDLDKAYDIAYISTNGNEKVAKNVRHIYDTFGNNVHIDVGISTTEQDMMKIYDGLTLETGYADVAFINNKNNTSYLRNPKIYMFEDPIDTIEMGGFLDAIVYNNIIEPYQSKKTDEVLSTVIFAPKLSRDYSSYMERLVKIMYNIAEVNDRPPLLIVTNITDTDKYYDLGQLCGAQPIRKYIHKDLYEKDVKLGLAPTVDNITEFCGSAEIVEADSFKTKVINPKNMYKEGTTEYSDVFNNLLIYLHTELAKAKEDSKDLVVINRLNKRIQSLQSNMIEYLVGGLTIADRDSLKDLVEDAVKNCQSASDHGVGFAANFEGLKASGKVDTEMSKIIYNAFVSTIKDLYEMSGIRENHDEIIQNMLDKNLPYDVMTKQYSDKLLSSIQSDIVILDSIAKIMTLMITTNQVICPDFRFNKYTID